MGVLSIVRGSWKDGKGEVQREEIGISFVVFVFFSFLFSRACQKKRK